MYSIIKRLREGGERRSDRDISSDPGTIGHLTVFAVKGVSVASLHAAGSTGSDDPLIPMLFRAKLCTLHNDRLLFKGYERPVGQEGVDSDRNRQEWAVQVMSEPSVRRRRNG
jgi:hypothetical protein